jgi:uncharacterized protein (DUF1499 family)
MEEVLKLQKDLEKMVKNNPGDYIIYASECWCKLDKKYRIVRFIDDVTWRIYDMVHEYNNNRIPDFNWCAKYFLGEVEIEKD